MPCSLLPKQDSKCCFLGSWWDHCLWDMYLCSSVRPTGTKAFLNPPVKLAFIVNYHSQRYPSIPQLYINVYLFVASVNILFVFLSQERGVVAVLNGHTGRVNTVQWVHREDCGECLLVGCDLDLCVLTVWFATTTNVQQHVTCVQVEVRHFLIIIIKL